MPAGFFVDDACKENQQRVGCGNATTENTTKTHPNPSPSPPSVTLAGAKQVMNFYELGNEWCNDRHGKGHALLINLPLSPRHLQGSERALVVDASWALPPGEGVLGVNRRHLKTVVVPNRSRKTKSVFS